MSIPPVNLKKFIELLKTDGRTELSMHAVASGKSGSLTLTAEFDRIILILEKEIIPLLSKGGDVKSLVGPVQRLVKSANVLSAMALNVLGFVPGPIGIVCSLIQAIVCFCMGNVIGGLFELLGCIPGGKVAGKVSSKLFQKFEKILIEMMRSNPALKFFLDAGSNKAKAVLDFCEKRGIKMGSNPEAIRSSSINKPSGLEQSLRNPFNNSEIAGRQEIRKYILNNKTYPTIYKTSIWPNI